MNVLVFSDSHGRVSRIDEMMECALACGGEKPSQILFLGDGLSDLARAHSLDGMSAVAVRGNCDMLFGGDEPETRIIGLGSYRALMMHGHTQGVKYGLTQAMAFAVRSDVDLLLFGHTHRPLALTFSEGSEYMGVQMKKPLYVFNPGSLAEGYFGRISLTDKGVLMSHGELFGTLW